MSEIGDCIEEAGDEVIEIKDHVMKLLGLESKLLYLHALALISNVDNNIDIREKRYLRVLIRSLDLPENDILPQIIENAKSPDKNLVKDFISHFKGNELAITFLFDALILACSDGGLSSVEKDGVKSFAEKLKYGDKIELIEEITFAIINKKISVILNVNSNKRLNLSSYSHLLEYYDFDSSDIARIKTNNYESIGIKWKPIEYSREDNLPDDFFDNMPEERLISNYITMGNIIKIMNNALNDKSIFIDDHNIMSSIDHFLVCDLRQSPLQYEKSDDKFIPKDIAQDEIASEATVYSSLLIGLTAFGIANIAHNQRSKNSVIESTIIWGFTPDGIRFLAKTIGCDLAHVFYNHLPLPNDIVKDELFVDDIDCFYLDSTTAKYKKREIKEACAIDSEEITKCCFRFVR